MDDKKVIEIEFCVKCNWLMRSAWMAQELILTFGKDLKAVSLIPGDGGIFEIRTDKIIIWSFKEKRRFPDIKELKQLARNIISPEKDLGHLDR